MGTDPESTDALVAVSDEIDFNLVGVVDALDSTFTAEFSIFRVLVATVGLLAVRELTASHVFIKEESREDLVTGKKLSIDVAFKFDELISIITVEGHLFLPLREERVGLEGLFACIQEA